MGLLTLSWDNTDILAEANVISQRASKRIKAVGGAYSTSGFSPSNDMAVSVTSTDATVTNNRVYEFKIESICTIGGPTLNSNGVQEGIFFACIAPTLSADTDSVDVDVNLFGTDITKVRYVLRKQSDNSIVGGPVIVNNVSNAAPHTFTGLDPNTGYYVTLELYAQVNGSQVISSDAEYLNTVCGGNVSGYQVETEAEEGVGNIVNEECIDTGRILDVKLDGDTVALEDMMIFPLTSGQSATTTPNPTGTVTLLVSVDGTASSIYVVDSNGTPQCLDYAGADNYTFPGFVIGATPWSVTLKCTPCV